MRKIFVKTNNVRNFIGLVENLQNKPKNIPKMGLVYGEPGLGKSQTALWLACKYDGIYIRASNLMTSRWFVEEIVREMDELPRYLTSDNFNVVISKLIQKPRIIFVDEIDYLMNNYKSVETLRDIHDKTDCPIIFVGMGLAHRKLERYKHLYDRFSDIVKFKTFGVNDIAQIINQLAEIQFTPESIEYIHKKYNRFRQIVQLINQMEIFAKDNNIAEITKEIEKDMDAKSRSNYFNLSGAKDVPWKQLMVAQGFVSDIESNLHGPITTAIADGNNPVDFYTSAAESRRGFFYSATRSAIKEYKVAA